MENDADRFEAEVMAELEQSMTPEIGKLALAMSKVQGEIHGAVKGAENPFFKSRYADLAQVWEACREPLSKHEIAVIQTTEPHSQGIVVVTLLTHSSGQWIKGRLRITPMKNDPQAIGSAITYARRYALAAMVGIAQVDDDAEAAMNRGPMNDASVDMKKVKKLADEALSVIESEDPEMVETPNQAKEIYIQLDNDERLEFQKLMKAKKYGNKMAWSIFREYLTIAAEKGEAA